MMKKDETLNDNEINPKLTDSEIGMVECCPDCDFENWYRSNAFAWKVCNDCGKVHKPCSLCNHDTCACTDCPLGKDRDVWVLESNTAGGMIDFGQQFGLDSYIKTIKRGVLNDEELVSAWLKGTSEGGIHMDEYGHEYYLITDTDQKSEFVIYPINLRCIVLIPHPLGDMLIDTADTTVKCDYIMYKRKKVKPKKAKA